MTHSETVLAPTRPRLTARTVRLADATDVVDFLGADGTAWLDGESGFVTAGIAATVEPAAAVAMLRTIEHDGSDAADAPAAIGPRAIGALPFAGAGRMIIPGRIVTRDPEGRVWCTEIEPAPRLTSVPVASPPSQYTINQVTTFSEWDASVAAALALIEAGACEKIVLAREVTIEADTSFDIRAILEILRKTQPGCIVYADGGFVGASPELLVRRTGESVIARPMAGTGLDAATLLRSEKDAREHRLVVDAVRAALEPACSDIDTSGPAPVTLTDVTHLATTITGRIRDRETSAVDLALSLHPTPAVAGTPRPAALAAIRRLEPTARDRYAGPCGWVDARGDGEFVVALRGAQMDGVCARLHAGAGIVAGSRAAAEWAETQAKLDPMLRALLRI